MLIQNQFKKLVLLEIQEKDATKFFIIKAMQETVSDFSKGTVKV